MALHARGLKAWLDNVGGGVGCLDAWSSEETGEVKDQDFRGDGGKKEDEHAYGREGWVAVAIVSLLVHFRLPRWEDTSWGELQEGMRRLWVPFTQAKDGERNSKVVEVPPVVVQYCYASTTGSRIAVLYTITMLQVVGMAELLDALAQELQGSSGVPAGAIMFIVLGVLERHYRGRGGEKAAVFQVALSRARTRGIRGFVGFGWFRDDERRCEQNGLAARW